MDTEKELTQKENGDQKKILKEIPQNRQQRRETISQESPKY